MLLCVVVVASVGSGWRRRLFSSSFELFKLIGDALKTAFFYLSGYHFLKAVKMIMWKRPTFFQRNVTQIIILLRKKDDKQLSLIGSKVNVTSEEQQLA